MMSSPLGWKLGLIRGGHTHCHNWDSNPGSRDCEPSALLLSYPTIPLIFNVHVHVNLSQKDRRWEVAMYILIKSSFLFSIWWRRFWIASNLFCNFSCLLRASSCNHVMNYSQSMKLNTAFIQITELGGRIRGSTTNCTSDISPSLWKTYVS